LTTDPVDVVPQDGRNDFYCWLCHREGQVLCCELCPRVYHAKCLKLPAEPEGDWFCPEKITVAECIETQSKAMMMLTIDQLSYLLKFALQKMKQPGTEPFQKPVSLDQHPDYAEYIFHPMDLCTLDKNIKKKMYGCTEAFLADVKWILHNCIIYNGGNHKLTATAKVIVKICEHEMSEIEVCPECYLSACQKRDNWFCEPCSNPHPLVWAKLKGFPFWPAKALRDKDGQVDARFFGQHDRAWVPLNNCYLMSKDIPFSVKKTKSIFNSAMQEMDVYVENMRKKFGVFNYASFRTPYTPDNNFQMLPDPSNPSSIPVTPEKKDKIKLAFDMTALPKIPLTRAVCSGVGLGGGAACQRLLVSEVPHSPQSPNSSAHTGSDGDHEASDKSQAKAGTSQCSGSSPSRSRRSSTGRSLDSPKLRSSHGATKQEKPPQTGSILNLNLDRSKAEMDLKELSETVQQKQDAAEVVTAPKRRIKSRFQLKLDKTIESCKAQLGIEELSVDVYKGVGRSDSEDSDKSETSDTEDASDEDQKSLDGQDAIPSKEPHNLLTKSKIKDKTCPDPEEDEDGQKEFLVTKAVDPGAVTDALTKEKVLSDSERSKTVPESPALRDRSQVRQENKQPVEDSDSERELVIDLGEEKSGKNKRRNRKEIILSFVVVFIEAVQQKDAPITSAVTLVSSNPVSTSSLSPAASTSLAHNDLYIPTASAEVAADIAKYTNKIMDAIKGTMTEIYNDLSKSSSGNTIAEIRRLRIEIEKLQWLHQQELSEMKHNLELTMAEMRQSLEQEKERMVVEVKKQMEQEKQQAVDETKKKQWCANCRKEAIFYCCWNTSYCDYPCQQAHWPEHMKSCTQSGNTRERSIVVSSMVFVRDSKESLTGNNAHLY
uniref:Protein kinase C-binding protein 1-like n=1 Tax=Gouania willdenowi TaxID=441366 RepID=A0A8C5GBG6_GOUWI